MSRTNEQSRKLHALIAKIYPKAMFDEMKAHHAFEVSDGRTSHTSDLTYAECNKLIKTLQLVLAINGSNRDELTPSRRKMLALMKSLEWDYDRLSRFISDQTGGKKNHSRQLTDSEVNNLVGVMEKIELQKLRK